ncbi:MULTISPECIES: hypothetical protein [Amycolatopsis]|uniref:Uncharacterized protein n=1 Tax=Amycolatopsis tucumanensis TaxID=401106 RepID=A0ABP7HKK9_9PSEU|nr:MULTISPECIES: hypothetical protein [Amycolatopsis]MCF6420682.1 hypothetical protein [Amycolatopsis tucumanensis]
MVAAEGPRPGPAAADLVLGGGALAVTALRSLARTALAPVRPVLAPVVRTGNWPAPLRELAEDGQRRRQEAVAHGVRLFRRVAPAVVVTVLDELDLAGIVRGVIEEIDLPEIIRTSTGSVANESVRDARIQAMAADDAVARWAGRIFAARRRPLPAGHDAAT